MTKELEPNLDWERFLKKTRNVVGQAYKGKDLERYMAPSYEAACATKNHAVVVIYIRSHKHRRVRLDG